MGARQAETEMAVRQLRFAMEKLAKIHGNPKHIGCGMRRTDDKHILFIYFTNSEKQYPEEIVLNPETVFMFYQTAPQEQSLNETPVYSRKDAHKMVQEAFMAVGG